MTPHPTLRIRSPRPDILEVANEKKKIRLAVKLCMRAAYSMVLLATFFLCSAVVTGNLIYLVWVGLALLGCLTCIQCVEKLQEESDSSGLETA